MGVKILHDSACHVLFPRHVGVVDEEGPSGCFMPQFPVRLILQDSETMTGSGRKQEARQAFWPANFPDDGAESQKEFQIRAKQQKFEKPCDVLFHHAAELGAVRSRIREHGPRGTI